METTNTIDRPKRTPIVQVPHEVFPSRYAKYAVTNYFNRGPYSKEFFHEVGRGNTKYIEAFFDRVNRFAAIVPNVSDYKEYAKWVYAWREEYKAITTVSQMFKVARRTGDVRVSNRLDEAARAALMVRRISSVANHLLILREFNKNAFISYNNP